MTHRMISALLALAPVAAAQPPLIDASFDGVDNDINPAFTIISNSQANGSGASWNQATGRINRGSANFSCAGVVSDSVINFPSLAGSPLILSVTVDAASGPVQSNGIFIGFQAAPGGANQPGNLWNNHGPAFGLVIDGGNRLGSMVVAPGGNATTGSSTGAGFQSLPAFGTASADSIHDGFTVTLTVDSSGWKFLIDGLRNPAGAMITGGSGRWNELPFDFAQFGTAMRVAVTTQGNGGGTLDLAAVTVTVGTEADMAIPGPPSFNTGPIIPFVDSDGDGFRDEAEIAFGSDAHDPDDIPDCRMIPAKPNLVIIYADDMGFGDMSAYGSLFGTPSPAETPRMDGLARQGVLFTQAHSSSAVCTPSRYALLTGKYNWREFHNISLHYGIGQIPDIPKPSDLTIAEFLKEQGYQTAAFGKWHLGGSWFQRGGNTRVTGNPSDPSLVDWARPVENHAVAHGFDYFRGLATSINMGPYVYMADDRMQFWDATLNGGSGAFRDARNSDPFQWFTTNQLNASVVGNKDSRASLGDPSYRQVDAEPIMIGQVEEWLAGRAGDNTPFFAYVSLYSPHLPWALTPHFVGADSDSGFYYRDWMREVDHRIGRVLDALDNNGFGENTMVVLTSDNGPENQAMSQSLSFGKDPNGPLRGNKRDVWDGGTRVPFVVRWPGQAAPGLVVTDLVWQGDIYATIAAALKVELAESVAPDAESFLNLLKGQRKPTPGRPGIVVSSIRGDLAYKTNDGWKFIDSSGGGDAVSWDSYNQRIDGAAGVNQGVPKQLYRQTSDLGENTNLLAGLTDISAIRDKLVELTGSDLLADLDELRAATTFSIHPRQPDNDGDGMPNAYEIQHGLDPDCPKDAHQDLDGDGASNLEEFIAGTDPTDPSDRFRITGIEVGEEEITLTWLAIPGREYRIWWSADGTEWNHDSTHEGISGPMSAIMNRNVAGDGAAARALLLRVSAHLR